MTSSLIDKTSRIAIVGAGPAGLSTAWFLGEEGFANVTVLEKLGRVGGLCKSLTVDGMSFDLGANYVTWGYQETLAIAKEVGASTYAEMPYTSIDLSPDGTGYRYRPLWEAVLTNPSGRKVSLFSFVLAAVRYVIVRFRLRDAIDIPDYLERIHERPELCVSFEDWLAAHRLMPLATLFQFPITIMGYGRLDEIAAPYALRYMSVRTFLPMVFGRPPVSWIAGEWPQRFTEGFQRVWERVAWRTDVRLNVKIMQITRSRHDGIRITMEYPEQQLNEIKLVRMTEVYDYLILACPLTPDVFGELGLKPNGSEHKISKAMQWNSYCMTTFWVDNMEMPEPIAPVLPLPDPGTPLGVARQFQGKGNMFTQFYTRRRSDQSDDEVIAAVKSLIERLGGAIDESHARWHTFDDFTYFQHFTTDQIAQGIYSELASMQGRDATFYVGGATSFELVEPIVAHSKYLVAEHFSGTAS